MSSALAVLPFPKPPPPDGEPTRVTFSSLGRVVACPPSAVLPGVRDLSPAPAAATGTAVHAFLRDVPTLGPEAALERVPWEHRHACEGIRLDLLVTVDPNAFAAEVAFIYDWDKDRARELDRGVDHRDYPCGPTEIAGRADVIGLTTTAVLVFDYKTGYAELGPAAESWQLRANALAAARAFGKAEAVVHFVRFIEGRPWYTSASFDFLDLDEAATSIRDVMERVAAMRKSGPALGLLATGPHCDHCPALRRCPAYVTLAAPAAGKELESFTLTTETAGLVYQRRETLRRLDKVITDALDKFAAQNPFPIGGGLVRGPTEVKTESFDPIKGALALAKAFDDDERVADEAVERTPCLTKASVERAVRRYKERTGSSVAVTTLKAKAIDALRDGGAAMVKREMKIRNHKP